LGTSIISMLSFKVVHFLWLPTTNHSSFLWNLIDSWESWVDGLLSYMNMILIIFLRPGSDNRDANGLSWNPSSNEENIKSSLIWEWRLGGNFEMSCLCIPSKMIRIISPKNYLINLIN
jgi:hypothetical protein